MRLRGRIESRFSFAANHSMLKVQVYLIEYVDKTPKSLKFRCLRHDSGKIAARPVERNGGAFRNNAGTDMNACHQV